MGATCPSLRFSALLVDDASDGFEIMMARSWHLKCDFASSRDIIVIIIIIIIVIIIAIIIISVIMITTRATTTTRTTTTLLVEDV